MPEPNNTPAEDRADEVLGEYMLRIDRGEAVDREEFLRQHPDVADELRGYFADSEAVGRQIGHAERDTDPKSQSTVALGPRVLGNYQVLKRIGEGGMGQVYKAQHLRMKRIVALKILPAEVAGSPDAVQRFQREVEAVARLSHPNIVTAHDADEANGVHFLVMEYVEGSDLARLVRERGPLPLTEALDYVIQAAKGLEYAHAQGVIHRDIKPSNLLLDPNGNIKVLDMGLARLSSEADSEAVAKGLTQMGTAMGTVDYMSPEQAEDTHQADARSDVYSLGCTMFYLLVGKPIYAGDTPVKKILAHRDAPVPSLALLRSDVPQGIDAVFQRMVAKSPPDRYQSMSEVVAELGKCREFLLTPADTTSSLPPALAKGRDAGPHGPAVPAGTLAAEEAASEEEKLKDDSLPAAVPAEPAMPKARAWARKRLALALLLVGIGLLGLAFGVIFKFRTTEGTLVVEISEPDVTVQVLSEEGKVEIQRQAQKGTLTIGVDPGKHRLRLEKDGFQVFAQDIAIASGREETIKAKLVLSKAEVESRGQTANVQFPQGAGTPPPLAIAPFDEKKAEEHQQAWAKYLSQPVEMTNSLGMKLVLIPPGEFDMGASPEEIAWALEEGKKRNMPEWYFGVVQSEAPRHRVRITKPFYLGMYHVTEGEYEKVMGINPNGSSDKQKGSSRHPVQMVSWDECVEFCRRLSTSPAESGRRRSYGLPTEAQWEFACRAGTTTRWSSGDDQATLQDCAWFQKNAQGMTLPVGEKRPNAWRLYDMHGNAGQWCSDWFRSGYYDLTCFNDPAGPADGFGHSFRGGGSGVDALWCRSAWRTSSLKSMSGLGFRVACVVAADNASPVAKPSEAVLPAPTAAQPSAAANRPLAGTDPPPSDSTSAGRWLGYFPGNDPVRALPEVAAYTNVVSDRCWREAGNYEKEVRQTFEAARRNRLHIVMFVSQHPSIQKFMEVGCRLVQANQDVVAAVCVQVPSTLSPAPPEEIKALSRMLKRDVPATKFWIDVGFTVNDGSELPFLAEADGLVLSCLRWTSPASIRQHVKVGLEKWLSKAKGRPVLLAWHALGPDRGGVPTSDPGTFRAMAEIVEEYHLAGLLLNSYEDLSFRQLSADGINTRPELVSEVREIASRWGIGPAAAAAPGANAP